MNSAAVRIETQAFAGPAPDLDPVVPAVVAARPESLLHFITCGSVDDGKSTLIGRLLYDSNAVFDDQLEALERDSKKFGTTGGDLDFALLVDGLSAEREQGITIDVAYRYFSTAARAFIIADTPGHEQYTRNMATGASDAELAVILVDARKGILPQTRRHSFITSMLGVKSVVVAINKMDLVDFAQDVFERIVADYKAILPDLGFTDVAYIPMSAKRGDNVATPSAAMPWYEGPTLIRHLETVEPKTLDEAHEPFRLPVQWVNRPNLDFRGFAGTIAGGRVKTGDAVVSLPAGRSSRVKAIFGPNGEVPEAASGEAVTLTLTDEIDASRGDVLVASGDRASPHKTVKAEILWMVDRPLIAGGRFLAKLGTSQTPASVRTLDHAVDIHTYRPRAANALLMNEIGRVTVAFDRPLVALPYAENRELGAFILIDQLKNETVALGLVREVGPSVTHVADGGEEEDDDEPAPASATLLQRAARLWLGADVRRNPERRKGAIRFRLVGAVLVALIGFVLGLGVPGALVLGVLDFALRPFLRFAVDRTERKPKAPEPGTVGDGAGI
ncbi:sulfate adenylyltransferase subunit CysN [Aureimonas leprariae]|uniref:Sulfate adenylyltransferase subunit 1 n=1 Tax=Plantimonas leprariae TaxID=2615207 RepID=A0A7V7PRS3_9HYPH|nr:sulfate adenylyltransferase subunit CysN [Aureimonas leprariae]KAB0681465.1 sulfate adenylyltransferase subunit CysN [Aureimonas leprariae]